jgi:hypothetical protein
MTEEISIDIRRSRSIASTSTSASLPASMVWVNKLTLTAGGDDTEGGCSGGGAVGAAGAAGGG